MFAKVLSFALITAVFVKAGSASEINSPNDIPDISEIQQKFKDADEKYQQIDDKSIFNVIPRIMKEVHAEMAKLDTNNKNYVTFNCSQYAKHLFDTVNHIYDTSNSQCNPDSQKVRFRHVKTIYEDLEPDLKDFKSIRSDVPYCSDMKCTNIIEKEKNEINTMYHQVLSAKITALNSLMTSFIKSATDCTMSSFPELQHDYSTAVDNTRKCIEQ